MSIPIVSVNTLYRAVTLTSALLFEAAIATILIDSNHKLIPYLAIGGAIVGVAAWFIKAYDVKGTIILSVDTIIINDPKGQRFYPLDQMESIWLINNEFEGDFVGPRSFATKRG